VPILTLPVAVLLSLIPMLYQGLTVNIMSLGGIAVAIGAMVDASIVLVENLHKRLATAIGAMQEVGPSLFFSLLVITVSFPPIFTLQGVEGGLFKPLAFTKTYSMGFAALLAVTLTPGLAALFVRGRVRREEANPLNRWLVAVYTPVVRFVVRHAKAVVAVAALLVATTVPVFLALNSEFMPPLDEGAILYMPTALPGMGATTAAEVLESMDARLAEFPEVASVFGKMGRADTATDPAPVGMVETVVVLEPREAWRPGVTWDSLVAEMDEALAYPGMPNVWWMPIQTRTEMLSTGIRSPLGIKIFGDDLAVIEAAAVDIERAVKRVPGTRSAFADRSTGGFYLDVVPDRRAAARYGLAVADVHDFVRVAAGGSSSPRPSRAASATRSASPTPATSARTPARWAAPSSPPRPAARSPCPRSPTSASPPAHRWCAARAAASSATSSSTRASGRWASTSRRRRRRSPSGSPCPRACGSSGPASSATSSGRASG